MRLRAMVRQVVDLAAGTAFLVAPSTGNAILTRRVQIASPDVFLIIRDGTRVSLRQLRGGLSC
jgi:hypothetical protein